MDFPPQHPALADAAPYEVRDLSRVMTPALAIYPRLVDRNIATTIRLLGGDPNRWRPHLKTAKLSAIHRRLVAQGVTHVKCATPLELLAACEDGVTDALVAFPVMGANAARVQQIAERHPHVRVSSLVESREQLAPWRGGRVGLFIDVNPGMNRTGLQQEREEDIIALARAIAEAGLEFRGVHYYDGHLARLEMEEREQVAHRGYDRLMRLMEALALAGLPVGEVVTAGTPAFPCTLSYQPFVSAPFLHRASPGTVVYADATCLGQLPAEYGYFPAALVLATVVSHPAPGRVTCDAGSKSVSPDAGTPTCVALGRPNLRGLAPSEEHLPLEVEAGATVPALGEALYLVPRHVCPTVNNFEHALMIEDGDIVGVERVTARGREAPLLPSE